ncbi:MAG: lipopolysaccharide transport periplasmic protein LptA [Halioglobus sp.]
MFSQPPKFLAMALMAWAMAINPVMALPDDNQQPIHISADQAVRNEKKGITIYKGNVEMAQGSLHITADKITIYRIVDEADKIVAKGKPAQLRQQPDPQKGLVHARAGMIEYYKAEARVQLSHDAEIEQDGSRVTGETIEYYIDKQLVKALSNSTQDDSRVKVVIPAQNLQKSEDNSGTTASE